MLTPLPELRVTQSLQMILARKLVQTGWIQLSMLSGVLGLISLPVAQSQAETPPVVSAALPLKAAPGEVEALLDLTDDLNRGGSSHAMLSMRVQTSRYERTLKIEVWTQGQEKSLLRVLSPRRDAGVATLKVADEAWNYLPKIDRTLKISASAMGGAWMGSHLTNDDLVRSSRLREDYTWVLLARPTPPLKGADSSKTTGNYHIKLTPKPDSPVVWGEVSVYINAQRLPIKMQYFNERQVLKREISFHDYQEISGRTVPMRMRVDPQKRGEFTELVYHKLTFDVELSPRTFSLQALKR